MRQQSEVRETFLLETSILERLCADLCNAVTQRADSAALLREIESANLFLIALDETRAWYRYHHLFADVLRQRLRQTAPARVNELHQRAAAWFEENHFWAEAISHALQAGEFQNAARLVEQAAMPLLIRGQGMTAQN